MANFSKTVSNTLYVFGPSPADNWGNMLWGEKWAYGSEDFRTTTLKTVSNSLSSSDAIGLQVTFSPTIRNTLSLSEDMTMEGLYDSEGYNYFFPDQNAENRPNTSYTILSATSASFSEESEPVTIWVVIQ